MARRARALTILLWLCVVLAAAGFVSDLAEYSLLGRLESNDFASRSEMLDPANASDNRQATIGLTQAALTMTAGIFAIVVVAKLTGRQQQWFHKHEAGHTLSSVT